MMELVETAVATGGTAVNGNPLIVGVSTDSRNVASGELFVALKGQHFDGHDFVQTALERGAAAVMVDQDWAQGHTPLAPAVVVTDTRFALGRMAADWRAKFSLPLVGITGSNGKTTVKEMTAEILRAQAAAEGYDPDLTILATMGNLNNDIGLPLMLLRLHVTHRAAVLEMGMNHPGEIAYLTRIARPTVAVVNNAQRAHLAGLGSMADVARAKGETFEALGEHDTAVINADDVFCSYWRNLNAGRRVFSFGLDSPADVRGVCQPGALGSVLAITTPWGAVQTRLQVPGLHNARNALAATAAALVVGASLDAVGQGLEDFSGVQGRLQVRLAEAGATLIDDSYNANPDSVRAAINVLAATPGRKILVLGDMGEIGGQASQFHDEIGGYAKSQGVDLLFVLGEYSKLAARNFGTGGRHFKDPEELVAALRPELNADAVVLIKGSRFMRMEHVVDAVALKGESDAA